MRRPSLPQPTGVVAMIFAVLAVVLGLMLQPGDARAQATSPPAQPQKVDQLLDLLADPEVQNWIDARKSTQPGTAARAENLLTEEKMFIEANLERIKLHLHDIVAAVPTFPQELSKVIATIRDDMAGTGPLRLLLLFSAFVAAGFAAQWLYWQLTARFRNWIANARQQTVQSRLVTMLSRFIYGVGSVLAFGLGSIGSFLAFDWPPRLRQLLIGYLAAVLVYRAARVVLEFLLSPPELKGFGEPARIRALPVSDSAASFWVRRLGFVVGWFAFGWATIALLAAHGLPLPSRQLTAYLLGAVLLWAGIDAIWRRAPARAIDGEPTTGSYFGGTLSRWLFSLLFVALYVLWVESAMRLFWILSIGAGLPFAVIGLRKLINNIMRPPGSALEGNHVPSVLAAIVERGLRSVLIVGAILFLSDKLGVDITEMTAQDTSFTRLMRGLFTAVVIALGADFFWHVIRTVIETKIAEAATPGEVSLEVAQRKGRIRTLLPIARNFLMIAIAVVAILMALSAIGVEIGPLVAGAGVVGVAIGFGAQTVVKDVISGVFYLLDDAFRIGEYIQSGSYKGTVESFSLRSVKLRHQRGPVYTVPFSALGAIQNMSRDWAIEKITISITYDSDVEKARKIIKKIGLELAKDPEFAAATIQPLKMQGIDAFGDSGMLLRMKLMTKPGEQFAIKRRALLLIKQAFDENGIKIAFPTVQVASEADAKAAAANQLIQKMKLDQQAAPAES